MIHVKAPDGSLAQFPDGTPDATIKSVMARSYGAPSAATARAQAYAQSQVNDPVGKAAAPIINGFFGGFAPEMAGGAAALGTGLRNAVAHVGIGHGDGYGMSDAYKAVSDAQRAQLAQTAAQHPVASMGGNFVGLLGNPITKLAGEAVGGAKGLLGATVRSAGVGAGLGAVTGAGFAGPGNRVQGAVQGGLIGAGTGAAAPGVAKVAGALYNRLGNVASNAVTGARQIAAPIPHNAPPSPTDTMAAAAKVQQIMAAQGKEIPHLAAPYGKPLTTAEAIGQPAQNSLAALARRPGATGDALKSQLVDRSQQMGPRLMDDFHAATGIHPTAAAGDIDGLVEHLQAKAKPLYDAALGGTDPVWNDTLANLAQRPVIKKAISSVGQDILNAGNDPTQAGLRLDPETGWTVAGGSVSDPKPTSLGATVQQQPTAATWDAVKKAIGRQVERNPITNAPLPDSQSEGNFGVRLATQHLTGALKDAIPGYSDALAASGDYLKLNDAFAKGQKLMLAPSVDEATFNDVYGGLSPAEQEAFKGGFANDLFNKAQNNQLKPNIVAAPRVQQKLQAVLGPDAADEFMQRANTEAQMAAAGGRMMPGTGSATNELGVADAGHEAGPDALSTFLGGLHNPLGMVSKLAQFGADQSTTPQIRNEMGRLLMQPPSATAQELQMLNVPPPSPNPLPGLLAPVNPATSGLLGSYGGQ